MFDTHTFLMELYVMVDDFCQGYEKPTIHPGPVASLSCSEVVTLGLFSQWQRFRSERDFYRFAQTHLRSPFPRLPHRSQFNRLMRRHHDVLAAFFVYDVQQLQGQAGYDFCYEALDTSAVPTRDAKRRGSGWLPEQAQIGWGNRLGWFEGFRLLISVNPQGIITGFCFGSGNAKDQPLAEDFLATRHQSHPVVLRWEPSRTAFMFQTKALKEPSISNAGSRSMERVCCALQNVMPSLNPCGPKVYGSGCRVFGR